MKEIFRTFIQDCIDYYCIIGVCVYIEYENVCTCEGLRRREEWIDANDAERVRYRTINKLQNVYQKKKKNKKKLKKNVLTCIIVKFEKTRKMASIIVSASNDRIGESRWLVFHIDQRSVMRNTEAVILDTHGRLWKIDGWRRTIYAKWNCCMILRYQIRISFTYLQLDSH